MPCAGAPPPYPPGAGAGDIMPNGSAAGWEKDGWLLDGAAAAPTPAPWPLLWPLAAGLATAVKAKLPSDEKASGAASCAGAGGGCWGAPPAAP
jgi:hypothetical protein